MFALLPLLIQLAGQFGPTLAGMLISPKAAEVTRTVVDVAKAVFGTDDPAAIEEAVKADPTLAQVFVAKLQAETEQYKAALADVQSARLQTVELARISSPIAWGAPIISVIVSGGFALLVLLWWIRPPAGDTASLQVFTLLVGALATSFGAVVQYWLGSSAGSANKDNIINAALITAQHNAGATKPAAR